MKTENTQSVNSLITKKVAYVSGLLVIPSALLAIKLGVTIARVIFTDAYFSSIAGAVIALLIFALSTWVTFACMKTGLLIEKEERQ